MVTKEKGITLVALVITVIVLIILAGVAISQLNGEHGFLKMVKQASEKYNNAVLKEENMIAQYEDVLDTTYEIVNSYVEFTYEPEGWTKDTVEVTLINNLADKGYTIEYSINNGSTWNAYIDKIVLNENTVVLGRLTKDGVVGKITTANIINIDKLAPNAFIPSSSNITEDSFTISANTTDTIANATNGQSGIKQYEFFYKKSTDTSYILAGVVTGITASKEVSGLEHTTDYNIKVIAYDNVGNYKESNIITIGTQQILTLNGIENTVVAVGKQYIERGAISSGNYTINISGTVNTAVTGQYILTYSSKDKYNRTKTIQRNVYVIENPTFIIDIYGRISGNCIAINELQFLNEEDITQTYSVNAYDSVRNGLPYYWNDPYTEGIGRVWGYPNLYDGSISYSSNRNGSLYCTVFCHSSYSDNWARLIAYNMTRNINKIRIAIGNTDGRTPKKITIYAVSNYDTNTYNNNVRTRSDEGLIKMGELEFTEDISTPTWYEILN